MFRHIDLKVILITIITIVFLTSVSMQSTFAQDADPPLPDEEEIIPELVDGELVDGVIQDPVTPDVEEIPEIDLPEIDPYLDDAEIAEEPKTVPDVVDKIADFTVRDYPNDSGGTFLLTWSLTGNEKAMLEAGEIPDYSYRIYRAPSDKVITDGNIGFDGDGVTFQDVVFGSTLADMRTTFWRNPRHQNFHAFQWTVPDLPIYEHVRLTDPRLISEENGTFIYELTRVGRSRQLFATSKRLALIEANPDLADETDTTIQIEVNGTRYTVNVHAVDNSLVRIAIPVELPSVFESIKIPRFNPEGQAETYPDFINTHYFQLTVVDADGFIHPVSSAQSGITVSNAFNILRVNNMLIAVLFCTVVLMFISNAKKGRELFIRKIAGLDAVDEAIGRATEMGKPILYLTGLDSMSNISTLAAVNILGQVARKVADYDSTIINPNRDPIVMSVCQEVVREAYMDAGRPDAYNPDSIFFITEDQFSFAAAVSGIMVREKPATNVFMGYYYAESLILAETGGSTGAIQIAGTDSLAQLPFFITTCDYTLIGEELFAASGYLSREPKLLGSMKGQDVGKFFFMIALFLGVILLTINNDWFFIKDLFQAD